MVRITAGLFVQKKWCLAGLGAMKKKKKSYFDGREVLPSYFLLQESIETYTKKVPEMLGEQREREREKKDFL